MRIHADSWRFVQIHADSCRFIQIQSDSCGFMQIHPDSCRFMRIHADPCRFMMIHADLVRFMQIHADSCRFVQIHADSCGFMHQIHAESCRFKQIHADLFRFKQPWRRTATDPGEKIKGLIGNQRFWKDEVRRRRGAAATRGSALRAVHRSGAPPRHAARSALPRLRDEKKKGLTGNHLGPKRAHARAARSPT